MWRFLRVAAVVSAAAAAMAAGVDRNGDGKVSREELAAAHASLFAQFDTDKNGVVTVAEADAHFMDVADFDRDGKVTKEENALYASEAAAADLAQCDANGDGALTGAEVKCIGTADSSP